MFVENMVEIKKQWWKYWAVLREIGCKHSLNETQEKLYCMSCDHVEKNSI